MQIRLLHSICYSLEANMFWCDENVEHFKLLNTWSFFIPKTESGQTDWNANKFSILSICSCNSNAEL